MLRLSLSLTLLAAACATAATPAQSQEPVVDIPMEELARQEAVAEWRNLDAKIQSALDAQEVGHAIEAAEAALVWADERIGRESAFAVISVDKLRMLLDFAERYEESEPLHRRALLSRERTLGDDAPETLNELNNLGAWYFARGRFPEAEKLLETAVEGRIRMLGETSADTAVSMNNLAAVMTRRGRFDKAEPLLLRVLELHEGDGRLSPEDTMLDRTSVV